MKIRAGFVSAFVTGFLLLGAGHALACTAVTAVPTTINTPGVYCLTGNLTHTSANTTAIIINSSSVVLDLAGYRLWYNGSGNSAAPGVQVAAGWRNIVVRNGLISDFLQGVLVEGNAVIVEDLRIQHIEDDFASSTGIEIGSGENDVIVRRNYIRNCRIAIFARGDSSQIVENHIIGGDLTYYDGIWIYGRNVLIDNNWFGRLNQGINFQLNGSGKYRNNLTADVSIPFTGGTNAGNNN